MFGKNKKEVLTITVTDSPAEQVWTLEGRLVWPWVYQLREKWRRARGIVQGRSCTVDLSGVTFADKLGEQMLRIMAYQGAQFVASSAEMRRVLGHLGHDGLTDLPSAR
jgi:hypothetical protein